MNPRAIIFKAETDEGNDPYVDCLEKNNISAIHIPVSVFEYVNSNCLRTKLESPEKYLGIILLSPRSVKAVAQVYSFDHKWREKIFYCVGEKTYNLAQTLLGAIPSGKDCGNAAALAEFIVQNKTCSKLPFLLPHGNLSLETLPEMLKENNIPLDCITVYKTLPNPNLKDSIKKSFENNPVVDYILYFSPSGVDFTLPTISECVPTISTIKFATIGPTTKAHLEKKGINVACCSERPNPQDFVFTILKSIEESSKI